VQDVAAIVNVSGQVKDTVAERRHKRTVAVHAGLTA
jgi:hypothetical protein